MTEDGPRTIALTARTLGACAERMPVPGYDRGRLRAGVVHVGVGGFHRAHQAMFHDRLLDAGAGLEWGICGVGVLGADRGMRDALAAQDHLYTLVLKHADGTYEPRVIGALAGHLLAPEDPEAVVRRMADPATRIVSLTITEGGYALDDGTGEFDPGTPGVAEDLAGEGPPRTVFGLVTEALRRRRDGGTGPFTVMSCDNLEGNGHLAQRSFTAFARLRDADLGEWVEAEVPFPNSMVDRITPVTTDADREQLRRRFGVEDRWPVVCEPFIQWVLEDRFAAGRPPYEQAGVQVVEDVRPYELMKLRLLNGAHQALSYFAALAGREHVHEAAQDERFRRFVRAYLREEAAPTLPPVPGVDLDAYEDTVIERFSNSEVRDTVARICEHTSDRIPKFVLPAIRERLAQGGEVRRGAAIVASWARYAEGADDAGRPLAMVDRLRERLMARAARHDEDLGAFLDDPQMFGELAGDERFTGPYREALASLRERGALATLDALS